MIISPKHVFALAAAALAGSFILPAYPQAQPPAPTEAPITLPRTVPADGKPQINGPRVASGTPGRVFLFRIPTTGVKPLTFSADNLPAGLTLNAATGIITGSLKQPGVVAATIHAKNAKGQADRDLVIVGGDHKLALTPPMGWNSWNGWGPSVDDQKVRVCADAFDSLGLADHGFAYVNVDDGWEMRGANGRANDGTILVNNKFPSMKELGAYIHAKGLKFGMYSSPGPTTCAGNCASWQHEEQDAKTWASWGVDYIKYDWCSYSSVAPRAAANDPKAVNTGRNASYTLDTLKKPYQVLRSALDKQDRDIVMSLCQYGWGNVWEWGAEDGINGNLWRATNDITDSWTSMSTIGFAQNGHETSTAPGHWNDTDMLEVGPVGGGRTGGNGVVGIPHPARMTQNEQITHIGLWSILAAPLILGCDLTHADDFTIALMSNDEVLAVDQDSLGVQGRRISSMNVDGTATGNVNARAMQVWARPLWDGTIAVGLFNLSGNPIKVGTTLKEINSGLKTNLTGTLPVRDLWYLRNLAPTADVISAEVPRHGIVLLKIGVPRPEAESIAALVKLHSAKPTTAPKP